MKNNRGGQNNRFHLATRCWSKTKGYELSGSASYPNDCSTMLMIKIKGGDKYDDKGVIRHSNYKNATTGLYELGCIEAVNLLVGLIWLILMKVGNQTEMKTLLVLTFSDWFKSFLPMFLYLTHLLTNPVWVSIYLPSSYIELFLRIFSVNCFVGNTKFCRHCNNLKCLLPSTSKQTICTNKLPWYCRNPISGGGDEGGHGGQTSDWALHRTPVC